MLKLQLYFPYKAIGFIWGFVIISRKFSQKEMIDEKNLFSYNHIINNILSLDKLFIISRFEKKLNYDLDNNVLKSKYDLQDFLVQGGLIPFVRKIPKL